MRQPGNDNRVRAARVRAGMSQYGLAIKTGLHPATISLAERGALSVAVAEKIAAALGLTAEELLA